MERKRLVFVLCACRMHGTFRNSEGTEGPDVISKETSLRQLDAAIHRGLISTTEALTLMQVIQSSDMASREDDVSSMLRDKVHQWTLMRATTNGRLPFKDFHDILDEIRPI